MGGRGSGRTGGQATVEASGCLILSVDYVMRPIRRIIQQAGGRIPTGHTVRVPWKRFWWTRGGDGEPAEVEVRLELRTWDGTAWLRYAVRHLNHGATRPHHYPVRMVSTPCRYGGLRWSWICPATERRVRKLYLPDGGERFLSRGLGGYPLAYASQRAGRFDEVHARLGRCYRKLGVQYHTVGQWVPPRPKSMRRMNYDNICAALAAAEKAFDEL